MNGTRTHNLKGKCANTQPQIGFKITVCILAFSTTPELADGFFGVNYLI